jgi:ABC-2 type transport system permease protein
MTTWSAVATVAAKDLRRRMRDRSALVLGFLAPMAIAAVMSFAFGGSEDFAITAAVVDGDRGAAAAGFRAMLDETGIVTVVAARDEAAAHSALDGGGADVAFVLPPGLSAAVGATAHAEVRVLVSADAPVARQVAVALADSFAARSNAVQLVLATGAEADIDQSGLVAEAVHAAAPAVLRAAPAGGRPLTAVSYFGPAMGIFFALFAVGFTARSYHAERREGTVDRILAAPVWPGAVLAGKALAAFAYALSSLTTMAVVTTLAFDADWGPPAAAAALLTATALAVAGLAALVIGASRGERQADGLAAIATFALVLLGGNFVFATTTPDVLRATALATPNGWALRAFTDLATGAPASAALQPVLVITGFAVAFGAAGVLLNRGTR